MIYKFLLSFVEWNVLSIQNGKKKISGDDFPNLFLKKIELLLLVLKMTFYVICGSHVFSLDSSGILG